MESEYGSANRNASLLVPRHARVIDPKYCDSEEIWIVERGAHVDYSVSHCPTHHYSQDFIILVL